ncbi:hypothetical protein [Streptomyces sp. UG1]
MSELGDFLKEQRAQIAPEQVGLPAVGNPRRVGGTSWIRPELLFLLS